jgi:hypothetical protein
MYTNGSIINIVVEFSKEVIFSQLPDAYSDMYVDFARKNRISCGIPYIELNSNALIPLRGYESPRSRKRLAFVYFVGTGEETPPGEQLDVVAGSSIEMNGGSVVAYGSGMDVNLTSMPMPGDEGDYPL